MEDVLSNALNAFKKLFNLVKSFEFETLYRYSTIPDFFSEKSFDVKYLSFHNVILISNGYNIDTFENLKIIVGSVYFSNVTKILSGNSS